MSTPHRRRPVGAPPPEPRAAGGGGSDLGARVLVALPAAALAIGLVAVGNPVFAAGMVVFAVICQHELFGMFHFASPSRLAGVIGVLGLIAAATFGTSDTVLLALMACVPATFLLILLQPAGGAPGVAVTMLGLVWVAAPFAFAVLLRDLDHGGAIVFAVLLGTFLGDTGAYGFGRVFGRTKLAPTISPNKTVEGLLGGLLVCVLVVWWTGLSQSWFGGGKAALLGLAIGIAGPIGDLFESYLKRDAGTKDTGSLFGAHGGALDRLDAVLFSIVVGYWVWRALG